MILLLLMISLGDQPKPMAVEIGDPIIDARVTTFDDATYDLETVMSSGIVFVLSLDCPYCAEAITTIPTYFAPSYHCVMLFVNDHDRVADYVASNQTLFEGIDVYTVSSEDLAPYDIETLPAFLGYGEGKLQIAFHGPLDHETSEKVLDLYTKRYPLDQ